MVGGQTLETIQSCVGSEKAQEKAECVGGSLGDEIFMGVRPPSWREPKY